jgi:hypothetical protein
VIRGLGRPPLRFSRWLPLLVAVAALGACAAEAMPAALTTGSGVSPPTAPPSADRARPEAGALPEDAGAAAPDAGAAGGIDEPALPVPDAAQDRSADRRDPDPDADPADGASGPEDAGGLRCNGHPALCARRFDQVVFPTAHNAMSNADDGWLIANQTHNMRRQLGDGIRAMLIDTYRANGRELLCHTNCAFGSRALGDALDDIADFLEENPREVLALLIEDYLPAADTERAFVAAGLTDKVYRHDPGSLWPTLGEMIADGRRLVVTAQNGRPPPAWYHHMWDLVWDTPYAFRSEAEFSCRLNRGAADNALFLLNHWIENPVPDPRLSAIANARETLLGRARRCQSESGQLPNFVAVNHYSSGALFEVVRTLNGL